ncbi:ATP-binding cassette transporter ABC4 [Lophium mytilinum]|uniref:ATP-binding cassette transporter ABC4 n=1 Tax=Lophium mytilinum TaxID=390894 RepID=A0A6A6Q9A7_9PEZI|nr:ATP-binding cassette transporter ABC4 [Lophium mytilinum]
MDLLPPNEKEILVRQVHHPTADVRYLQLYRYASRKEIIICWISVFAAIIAGILVPMMTVVFGQLTATFQGVFMHTVDYPTFHAQLHKYTLYFVYLGLGEFVSTYICTCGNLYTGERIAGKIREKYLEAILRQNVGYFDKLGSGEITTRITADSNTVQDGVSEKVGFTLSSVATFVTAFVIGFVKSWKLTLILSATIVAIVLIMGGGSRFIMKFTRASLIAYARGGAVAEEVLSSVRNAKAFGTEEKLARKYDGVLNISEGFGRKSKYVMACMLAFMMTIVYMNYGLAFWMGSKFLVTGEVHVGQIVTTLMSIMIGSFALGHVGPWIQAFGSASAAAGKIFATIDRISPMDPTSNTGYKPEKVAGEITLRNVKHIYPSRPEVTVMNGVDLTVPAGKTTALVGSSGSGKSTIIGLVERFYDPVAGEVLLDGRNVQGLNLNWLRQQVSLVQQEPVLFATSIYKNIRYGLIGSDFDYLPEERTKNLVIEAAKFANAHDFIEALPEGYETNVGDRGFLLSGGQKQRIAIARAIVSDPKILLLDEATSALDTKSEGVVQAALDKACNGRTTIVIAHRLSTIRDADNIVVMDKGKIVEQGTHDQLLDKRGMYWSLVEAQRFASSETTEKFDEMGDLESEDSDNPFTDPSVTEVEFYDHDMDKKISRRQSARSVSSQILGDELPEKPKTYSMWTILKFIWSFNIKEWKLMSTGLFFCIIAGGGNPVQSVFFAKTLTSLSLPPNEYHELRNEVNFWSGMYLMLAAVQWVAWASQGICFAYCSERLIHRVRDHAFRTMIRQDVGFFDDEKNTAAKLTTALAQEATYLAGLSGTTLGTLCMAITTLTASLTMAIIVGWKLALVCISTVPVLMLCGFLRFWLLAKFQVRAKITYEKSASFACEATSAIKTVASLTREVDVWTQYHDQITSQNKDGVKAILQSSSLYAASQAFNFFCTGLGFWYGGSLLGHGEYDMFQFFVVFSSVIFGAQSAGSVFAFAPDISKAKGAASMFKTLFDRKPTIDAWSQDGIKMHDMDGYVEFRDVHFRYPTRPNQPVLRGLNISVKPGQYVALVGGSGCGKSTTIQLLERFYDPLVGGVYVDGQNIANLNVNDYRKHIALVSQEPTLYQGTIKDNILLGADTKGVEVPEHAIIKACQDANIYDFIMSLPEGFNTVCGNKGGLLSGGQKQRIAIARALLRDPKILLLDEATSALDSESEAVVQAALDAAAQGRTTIAVAHRLSTIQRADVIYVFDQGQVVEHGTHRELLGRRGRYFELVNMQSLERAG